MGSVHKIPDEVVDIIRLSGVPLSDIARDLGVDEAHLAAFMTDATTQQPELEQGELTDQQQQQQQPDDQMLLRQQLQKWAAKYAQRLEQTNDPLSSPQAVSPSLSLDENPVSAAPVVPTETTSPSESVPMKQESIEVKQEPVEIQHQSVDVMKEPSIADTVALGRVSSFLGDVRAKSMLCPVKIDESFKSLRYQDEFIWDINNTGLTADMFTMLLLKDVSLPESLFKEPIRRSIISQTTEFQAIMQMDPKVALADLLHGLLIINLDITINGFRLQDTIYWDPYYFPDSVELFASTTCKDLGLSGDWAAKIAFDIRWNVLQHRKAVHFNNPSPLQRYVPPSRIKFRPIRSIHEACSNDALQPVAQ